MGCGGLGRGQMPECCCGGGGGGGDDDDDDDVFYSVKKTVL